MVFVIGVGREVIMKYIIKIFFTFLLFIFANNIFAKEVSSNADIILFYGDGCPHCEKAQVYLNELKELYPDLIIEELEVYKNVDNQKRMSEISDNLETEVKGVPFIVIGENYIFGYDSNGRTNKQILNYLNIENSVEKVTEEESTSIDLPLFGTISTGSISLPIFTIMVAVIDGFNPCAMWTLLFLLSILVGMKDKKRMWILGSFFIMASAFVYFIFLAAWFNFFSFFAYVTWIKIVIGIIALVAGGYYLKEAIKNPTGACHITNNSKKSIILEKIKIFTRSQSLIVGVLGMIVLAIAVNIIELACSAGLPAVYTQVLSINELPVWQYYSYLLLYVLVFMIDDLFIFFTAMMTLKITGIQGKYSQISHWIGGILLLIIGILLIFKPDWLMIG